MPICILYYLHGPNFVSHHEMQWQIQNRLTQWLRFPDLSTLQKWKCLSLASDNIKSRYLIFYEI